MFTDYTPDGEAVGFIENVIAAEWERKMYGAGKFDIEVPATPAMLALLKHDRIVVNNGEAGIIETIKFEREDDAPILTVSGCELAGVINRRLMMQEEGLDRIVLEKLCMDYSPVNMEDWAQMVNKIKNPQKKVKVAVVGKYVELPDAYISVTEALRHAGIYNDAAVKIHWVNSEKLEDANVDMDEEFAGCKGILVPGGFGDRGVEGKIKAIQYAREHKLPFLGLCLGMQCAVIEFARHVCGMNGAHSTEFNSETEYPVIDLMASQVDVEDKGGTMRLGAYPCKVQKDTNTFAAYGQEMISERHRHRYEFNNAFRQQLSEAGMVIAGTLPDDSLVEIVEVKDHPWFVASQFHPELKSRPNHPHPLFKGFVTAALAMK